MGFCNGPAERPLVPPNIRGTETLRKFLTQRLGQTRAVANKVISEMESQPSAPAVVEHVRLDVAELAAIVKELERAETARLDALA